MGRRDDGIIRIERKRLGPLHRRRSPAYPLAPISAILAALESPELFATQRERVTRKE